MHSITLSRPISWWLGPFGQIWFCKIIRVHCCGGLAMLWQSTLGCTGSMCTLNSSPFNAFNTLSMSLIRLINFSTEESS